jgi:hypothetical protein
VRQCGVEPALRSRSILLFIDRAGAAFRRRPAGRIAAKGLADELNDRRYP